jgi:hypothetical protein
VLARNGNGVSAPSNVVGIVVQSVVTPPPPPTGLSVSVNGSSVTFSAQLPNVPLTGLLLVAGASPGAAQAVLPLAVSGQNTVNNVPPGVYYGRLVALNGRRPERAVERSADRRERGHLLGACRADPVGAGQRCGRRPPGAPCPVP